MSDAIREITQARCHRIRESGAERAVETLLQEIGEDPSGDGLRETPSRVVKALREMTAGYAEDPAEILAKTFEEHSDELIILRGIDFYSTCEHHLLPFHGVATVGYLPGKVVGISKLARLVHCFASGRRRRRAPRCVSIATAMRPCSRYGAAA